MTPDIQERAERLMHTIADAMMLEGLSPEAVAALISQALLEAHKAGRAEMKEEAAKVADRWANDRPDDYLEPEAATGRNVAAKFIATAIRNIT